MNYALNLDDLFSQRPKVDYNPHPLKAFFTDRNVCQKNIAEQLGVTGFALNCWLCGRVAMPPAGEEQLMQLKAKIIVWEKERGRKFGQ